MKSSTFKFKAEEAEAIVEAEKIKEKLGPLLQHTMDWWLKPQTFISYSSSVRVPQGGMPEAKKGKE